MFYGHYCSQLGCVPTCRYFTATKLDQIRARHHCICLRSLPPWKEAIKIEKGEALLQVSGQDILDQTPIFDIKPYLPKVDMRLQANSGWTENICGPEKTEVTFSESALQELQNLNIGKREEKKLIELIQEILHLDPRPGHQQKKNGTRKYSFKLLNYDVHWEKTDLGFKVHQIESLQI